MRSAHATLSREGRDALWLLAVLSLSISPHLGRLPLWCSAGTCAAIAWRSWLAWRDATLPPRWVLVVAMAAGIGLTALTYHSVLGREASVTLVTLLAGLKTLELRARRDAFVITSLGFFLVLTQFLYSQSLPMAALMLIAVLGLLSTLVLAERPTGRPSIGSAMKTATKSVLIGLPLMLALYLLFPRMGPLWSLPSDAGQRTGLSDSITLGTVAELALDDSIAMRLRFTRSTLPPQRLYFRGPVLDQFDGTSWRTSATPKDEAPETLFSPASPHQAPPIAYQITLEPSRLKVVPLIEGTVTAHPTPPLSEPILRHSGLNWHSPGPLLERTQFDAEVQPDLPQGKDLPPQALKHWLELPVGLNPRTLAWAHKTMQRPDLVQADALARSAAVLRHIRENAFRYTLAPGPEPTLPNGQVDPNLIDRFWIDRQQGFCEHFATAFVVVMRAMNVPSRVVTGFQGAELNPVDGMLVVRNSDAHAWAEVWQVGQGWVRVDPTAAVAPERIDRARPALRRSSNLPGPLSTLDPSQWVGLRNYIEAGNHRWNVWVLSYSRKQQLSLLQDWGIENADWPDLLRLCAGALASFSLGGLLWLRLTRPRQRHKPWHRPLMRIHRALVLAGIPPPEHAMAPAPALTWATAVEQWERKRHSPARSQNANAGKLAEELTHALRELDAQRYGPQGSQPKTAQTIKRILSLAKQWRAT